MASLFHELKRRNVFRAGAAYVVTTWLIIQVVETIFPAFGFGDAAVRVVVITLGIGFIPAVALAWAFELTPNGLQRDSKVDRASPVIQKMARRADRLIMVVLALAVGYFLFDRLVLSPSREARIAQEARKQGAEQVIERTRLGRTFEKSIAVLPFVSRNTGEESELFTVGMHDELLTQLTHIPTLRVISRSSVMPYRASDKPIPEIGRELAVATVLEGAVQQVGNQVRVNVQLIDTQADENLWAESFDRELTAENLFAIQSEISARIAEALDAKLSPEEESRAFQLPTANMEAYNNYMLGRQLVATRRTEDLVQALSLFEQSVEIDPEFARAWVEVADTLGLLANRGVLQRPEVLPRRKEAVETALALDYELGEAYTSLGAVYEGEGKLEEARAAYSRSIKLSPNYSRAYQWYADTFNALEDLPRALGLYYEAAELDPLSPVLSHSIAVILSQLGQDKEAIEQYHRLIQIDSDFSDAYSLLGELHARNGRLAEAVSWHRKALQIDPDSGWNLKRYADVYLALGELDEVRNIVGRLDELRGPGNRYAIMVEYYLLLAESDWQSTVERAEQLRPGELPPQLIQRGLAFAHLVGRDFEKAYEHWLRWEPGWADPGQWPQLIREPLYGCWTAGMLIAVGETQRGQQLLQQTLHYLEVELPGLVQHIDRHFGSLGTCQLIAGAEEKAFEHFTQFARHGHVSQWYLTKQEPWWDQVHDLPRLRELSNLNEEKLAVQREMLRKLDEQNLVVQ